MDSLPIPEKYWRRTKPLSPEEIKAQDKNIDDHQVLEENTVGKIQHKIDETKAAKAPFQEKTQNQRHRAQARGRDHGYGNRQPPAR